MKKRFLTAITGGAFILFITYSGGILFVMTYFAITLLALHEIELTLKKYYNITTYKINYIFSLLMIIAEIFGHDEYVKYLIIIYVVANMLLYLANHNIRIIDISIVIMTGLYVVLFFYCMILLNETIYVWIVYAITYSTDTFAYLVGSKIGKRRIFPLLSPRKTLEGLIGGLIGSLIVTQILNIYFFRIESYYMIPLILIASLMSVVGDLTASKIKRETKIKDFSNFLPGHGGIMDRFDSLLFVAPTVYLFYIILG